MYLCLLGCFSSFHLGDTNLASEVSRTGRRVLGAIHENIIISTPRNDVLRHKNELNPVVTRSDFGDMLFLGFLFSTSCQGCLLILASLGVLFLRNYAAQNISIPQQKSLVSVRSALRTQILTHDAHFLSRSS